MEEYIHDCVHIFFRICVWFTWCFISGVVIDPGQVWLKAQLANKRNTSASHHVFWQDRMPKQDAQLVVHWSGLVRSVETTLYRRPSKIYDIDIQANLASLRQQTYGYAWMISSGCLRSNSKARRRSFSGLSILTTWHTSILIDSEMPRVLRSMTSLFLRYVKWWSTPKFSAQSIHNHGMFFC